MCFKRTALVLAFVSVTIGFHVPSIAMEPLRLKMIPFSEFTHNKIIGDYSILIPVPENYEYVADKIKGASLSSSFWMVNQDVQKFITSKGALSENGFMHGTISVGASYDRSRDLFVGGDDPSTISNIKKLVSNLSLERFQAGPHAVLLSTGQVKKSLRYVYTMHVATNIGTNVALVSYSPANNDKALGDLVWGKLKNGLVKQSAIHKRKPASEQPPSVSLKESMLAMQKADTHKSAIIKFAKLASDIKTDDLIAMFSKEIRQNEGDVKLRAILLGIIIPFFTDFTSVDTYKNVAQSQFHDGRIVLIHYTYIITDDGTRKPFTIAFIDDAGSLKVVDIAVNKCVKSRHPVSKGRCDNKEQR